MIDHLIKRYFGRIYDESRRAAEDVQRSQQATLAQLVAEGARTRWGSDHGLAAVGSSRATSYAEFRRRLPVVGYEDIRPLAMRMVEGEADVLWPGVTRRFAQSSGTSDGKSKYIPLTDRSLRRCHFRGGSESVAYYLHHHPESRMFFGKNLILGGSYANELTLPRRVRVGDLSATLIDCINPLANLTRVPSKRVALMADWQRKLPAIVEATMRRDVRSISGVPSWFLTVLKEIMRRSGARELHEVWPNLEVFFHGGISFQPYRQPYDEIIDHRRMRYQENYNASEGFFAVQSRPGSPAMTLLMDNDTFYEFIPIGGDAADAIPAWELTPGRIYEMVITSSNGLWRYHMGDTVKVLATQPAVEITIAGRTKHYINAFGEEVMVHNTDAALADACRQTGASVLNYTAAPVFADGRHRGRHEWLIEFDRPPKSLPDFAHILDQALQRQNSDYQAKRAGGLFLDELTIRVGRAGVFDQWLASTGKLGGQRKVPRLSNDRRYIDPMLRFNEATSTSYTDN